MLRFIALVSVTPHDQPLRYHTGKIFGFPYNEQRGIGKLRPIWHIGARGHKRYAFDGRWMTLQI